MSSLTFEQLSVVVSESDLVVFGPPAQVDVQVDIGRQGNRGSYIWAGSGRPTVNMINPPWEDTGLQYYDFYIDQNTGTDYSYLYQYQPMSGGADFRLIVKLNPTVYRSNIIMEFNAGVANVDIALASIFGGNPPSNTTGDQYIINLEFERLTPNASTSNPISHTVTGRVVNTGTNALSFEVTAVEFDRENNEWILLDTNSTTEPGVNDGVNVMVNITTTAPQ